MEFNIPKEAFPSPSRPKNISQFLTPSRVVHYFLFLACTVVCCYQIGEFLMLYLKYETTINVEIKVPMKDPLLGYSFCVSNLLQKEVLKQKYPDCCEEESSQSQTIEQLFKNMTAEERATHGKIDIGNNQMLNMYQYALSGGKLKYKFVNTGEMNCLSFNPNWNGDNPLEDLFTELHSSVFAIMKHPEWISIRNESISKSYQLYILPREVIPSSRHSPLFISYGNMCGFMLNKIVVNRMKPPYATKCVDYSQDVADNHSLLFLNQENCYTRCLWQESQKRCNCILDRLGFFEDFNLCSEADANKCEMLMNDANDFCESSCPTECRFEYYEAKQSCSSGKATSRNKHMATTIYLRIQLNSVKHIIYTHVPKIEGIEIFSIIGGYVGIWLGISILFLFDYAGKAIMKMKTK